MIEATRTTTQLLDALSDMGNDGAWRELDRRYRPILINFARRLGLNDTEAADAAQEAMLVFAREYSKGSYDRSRGRLRQWLIGIARREALKARRRSARDAAPPGEAHQADDNALEQLWEREQRAVILDEAIRELRGRPGTAPQTLEIFELSVVRQMPAAEVAAALDIDVDSVYVARSRCLKRLRTIVERLELAYEGE
jgi:RNA polymerase sigma factor (sigma-70 family)